MSSTSAPSSDSRANPWQLSKTQLEMAMLRKPPLDSVPSLMRPVAGQWGSGWSFQEPSRTEPSSIAAGDVAVGDGDVLSGAGVAEGEGGLGADAVVPGGVDGAVGDADVAAAVDVEAVAIGVEEEVVDGEVVDAGGEEAEVAAFKDGEVAEQDVAAVFEGDGLVADAGLGRIGFAGVFDPVPAAGEAFAPDEAGAGDGDVVEAFAPEQGVVPVVMAVVLIGLPGALRFGEVVGAGGGDAFHGAGRGEQDGTVIEMEADIALEMDGVGEVDAGGEDGRCRRRRWPRPGWLD